MSTSVLPEDSVQKKKAYRRRMNESGKPLRRLIFTLDEHDHAIVSRAVSLRTSPLFSRAYGSSSLDLTGPEDEVSGKGLADICTVWQATLELGANGKTA